MKRYAFGITWTHVGLAATAVVLAYSLVHLIRDLGCNP